MSRRWIAGMLCVTMAAGLAAGCGNSEASADTALQSSAVGESGGSSSAGDDGTAGGDYTAADSGSDATTQADGSGNIDWDEDPALVNWYMWGVGVSAPSTEALDRVEEKINAITEPAINVTVNLEMLEMGNYLTQMPMQITAGDKIDLITTFPAGGGSFNTMAASGQLLPLDDLIADYCQEMTAMVPENFFDATTINGTIYGAPIYTDYTNDLYFICKKEIFDETGFDESDFTSYEDLTVLFDKVKELHPEMKVISSGAQSITGSVGVTLNNEKFDPLTEIAVVFYEKEGQETKVVNLFETEEYRREAQIYRDWFNAGYIDQDILMRETDGTDDPTFLAASFRGILPERSRSCPWAVQS